MSHHYTTRLHEAAEAKQTPVLVGLDPRLDQLPPDVLAHARELYDDPAAQAAAAFEEFCIRLIDVVAP